MKTYLALSQLKYYLEDTDKVFKALFSFSFVFLHKRACIELWAHAILALLDSKSLQVDSFHLFLALHVFESLLGVAHVLLLLLYHSETFTLHDAVILRAAHIYHVIIIVVLHLWLRLLVIHFVLLELSHIAHLPIFLDFY